MANHIINFEDIANLSVHEAIKKIESLQGIKLSEIKMKDFVFHDNKAISSGRGVYLFKNESMFYYVGDCTSRSFIERIPCHFDTKPEAWMNIVVKHYAQRTLNLPLDNSSLEYASEYILDNFSVVMINFIEYDKDKIAAFERLLLSTLDTINKLKKPLIIDSNAIISDLC